MQLKFRLAPSDRAALVGEILLGVDINNWNLGFSFSMAPGALDEQFLDAIEGVFFSEALNNNQDPLPPEATELATNPSLWGNVTFEFAPGQLVSLTDLAANLELWPLDCAVVTQARGTLSDILGATIRAGNGSFGDYEEVQLTLDAVFTPRGGSELRDHSIGGKSICLFNVNFDEAMALLMTAADGATDETGAPAPVANPVLAVMPYSRTAMVAGKTGLPPCRPLALLDADAYTKMQGALRAAGFAPRAILVFGIDPAKVNVRSWEQDES